MYSMTAMPPCATSLYKILSRVCFLYVDMLNKVSFFLDKISFYAVFCFLFLLIWGVGVKTFSQAVVADVKIFLHCVSYWGRK